MFSKLLLFVLLACFISACVKREAPPTYPAEVKFTGTGDCLSQLKRQFEAFADGQSSAGELHQFWGCMHASIQKFQDITSGDGAGGDQYSAESLRHFIEHYFYNGHIPDDVLAAMMQVKRVLLSGDAHQVTRAELERLHGLFTEFEDVTVALAPHMRVILRKDKGADEPRVLAAAVELQLAAARLGHWLSERNQTLTFAQVNSAIDALAKWTAKSGTETSGMTTLRQAATLLPEAKELLIAGDKTGVTGGDWAPLTAALGRGYFLYLAFSNGCDENLDAALTRMSVPEGARAALDVLAQSARLHVSSLIPLGEFSALYTKLQSTGWLAATITEPALTTATKWLFTRLLGDGVTPSAGLTGVQIAKLQQLTSDWQTLGNSPPDSKLALVQEFNAMLASSKPIEWDALGRMQFPVAMPTSWSTSARAHMALPYALLKLVKRAYVGDAPLGFSEDDVNVVAHEVLPLLQNFGWMMSTKESIGRRILREADLFTLASNGDGILDLNEGARYIAFVLSSYRSAQAWLDLAKPACPHGEASCVRAAGADPASSIWQHMPRLQHAMQTWPAGAFRSYMMNAEQTILGAPEATAFSTGDLLQTFQLFEYVEVFLELYDRDQSETIDLDEAIAAYKVYGPTLGRLLPGSDLGFFTFMFKYGDVYLTMYGGAIEFNMWQWHHEKWTFAADRPVLMKILSQLARFASQ